MAEEARLESVYTPKAYPEFESRSLRKDFYLREGMPAIDIPFILLVSADIWMIELNVSQGLEKAYPIFKKNMG